MKPLIVLVVTFIIAVIITRLTRNEYAWQLSGRIAMAVMLFFTASAHFAFAKGMEMMMPPSLPYKKFLVAFTGVLEILAGIGLLISPLYHITGICLVIFFLAVLPANIYAAMQRVDYQKGTYEGSGRSYLWFRIPLQVLFSAWVYFSAIAG
jgi:uncharacterized membrane protein